MKIRLGFVSNSSSSSFVCGVCGYSYEGYDGMYDTEYHCCSLGHEICGSCAPNVKLAVKALSNNIDKAIEQLGLSDSDVNDLMGSKDKAAWIMEYAMIDGEMDPAICPICNLTHISGSLEAQYLREKFGLKRDDVLKEIRDKFGNLNGWSKRNED